MLTGVAFVGLGSFVNLSLPSGAISIKLPLTLWFAVGFLAVVFHILGDLPTMTKIQPFWPLKRECGGWRLFHASNVAVNSLFFIIGFIVFAVVVATQTSSPTEFLKEIIETRQTAL